MSPFKHIGNQTVTVSEVDELAISVVMLFNFLWDVKGLCTVIPQDSQQVYRGP